MNQGYLVDTDWAIDHLNGQERTRKRLEQHAGELKFSIISLAEVYEGIYYSTDPACNERVLREFLHSVNIIGIDEETSRIFGKIRGQLRAGGKLIDKFDLMIAATALRHDFTLFTNNRRHFENINDLHIESII